MSGIRTPAGRIVVGFDGSASSRDALAWAARQAELTGCSLDVAATWEYPVFFGQSPGLPSDFDPGALAHREMEVAVREILGQHPAVSVQIHVRESRPAPALVEASQGAELLVVGCRGHGELAGMLLGSVSQHCVTHARCPVVVVHEGGAGVGAAEIPERQLT